MTGKKNANNRIYSGAITEFTRNEVVGHGGNGSVYNVNITKGEVDSPVVAKFFDCKKNKIEKQKRYERFKKEVSEIKKWQDEIPGIIHIIDYNCPMRVSTNNEAWYLMPKATEYRINSSKDILGKLRDMIELAKTIEMLHERKLAHRDIKPENILILSSKVILSDFGLVWTICEDRITDSGDRIGPYKILPPELEDIILDKDIDYYPSDVYLLAKVIWMVVRENNAGFRGRYNRGDNQIYLDRKKYNVKTLEPLHCLLEGATEDSMTNRIDIHKCIEYLNLQIDIINGNIREDIEEMFYYDELSKELINFEIPNEYVYTDRSIIYKYLESIVKYARVFVSSNMERKIEISINSLNVTANAYANMYLFSPDGRIIKEYLFKAKRLVYKKNGVMMIETEEIDQYDEEFITYGESRRGFGNHGRKIVLDKEYTIEVCSKNKQDLK